MTNEEIIVKVNEWQDAGFVHPLTCFKDSKHPKLIPVIIDNKVKLTCTECGSVQEIIPKVVLEVEDGYIKHHKSWLLNKGANF